MGSDGKQGLSSTGILWLVLLGAGALFLREVPWQGSRPVGVEMKRYAKAAYQDVDARLWQDPMGAVAQAREEQRKRDASDAKSKDATGAAGRCSPRIRSLAVGAVLRQRDPPSQEQGCAGHRRDGLGRSLSRADRFRRRARYAILAGLNETGFVPEDEEHLGYFFPDTRERANPAEKPLPEFIAYEWLVPAEAEPAGHAAARAFGDAPCEESVLVLWLDEDSFGDNPNDKVQSVAARSLLECAIGEGKAGPPTMVDRTRSSSSSGRRRPGRCNHDRQAWRRR